MNAILTNLADLMNASGFELDGNYQAAIAAIAQFIAVFIRDHDIRALRCAGLCGYLELLHRAFRAAGKGKVLFGRGDLVFV